MGVCLERSFLEIKIFVSTRDLVILARAIVVVWRWYVGIVIVRWIRESIQAPGLQILYT